MSYVLYIVFPFCPSGIILYLFILYFLLLFLYILNSKTFFFLFFGRTVIYFIFFCLFLSFLKWERNDYKPSRVCASEYWNIIIFIFSRNITKKILSVVRDIVTYNFYLFIYFFFDFIHLRFAIIFRCFIEQFCAVATFIGSRAQNKKILDTKKANEQKQKGQL